MCYAPELGYTPSDDYLLNYLQNDPSFCDVSFSRTLHLGTFGGELSDALATPLSIYGKRTCYQLLQYSPLLDSSNMTMQQWQQIASDIERFYQHFDAFIVLHGTDTMAYTASCLSFMLESLGKAVILTGSQIPMSEIRNDGHDNLIGALTIAGHFCIPEVTVYFNRKLLRGNRCSKISATGLDAFEVPNSRPLVKLETHADVDWESVLKLPKGAKFSVHKLLNPNVAAIRMFPGITTESVRAFVSFPTQGVVIETYGSGNVPTNRPDLLRIFKEASDQGVVIVNCTQCRHGRVSDSYETSKQLKEIGIVSGSDMTLECALTKLSHCLGNYSIEKTRQLMGKSMRGELTRESKPRFSVHASSTSSIESSPNQGLAGCEKLN